MRFLFSVLFLLGASSAFAVDFVPGIAVTDAGRIADSSATRFFAFYIPADTDPNSVSADVQKNLLGAAKGKVGLAIIGPDYALNAKILLAALEAAPTGSLAGATIFYVNGGDAEEALSSAAAIAGAIFRSTKYSGK
ncbi:MAG: hypothetical protein K2Q07_10010 [Burkholderiaceae bacterium]|nr:hypothetical protein [Burkholderiaceae bacterium]